MRAFDTESPQFHSLSASVQAQRTQSQRTVKGAKNSTFHQILEQVLDCLSPNQEPRVHCRQNRQGKTVWIVHDPSSQTTRQFGSEHEVRVWLEQRYYQEM
ncbi:MAG TPA: hypothetical protein V6D07_05285 [Trichocoleus sp.]